MQREMATNKICAIEGCGKPVIARGWCRKHYYRWKHHGHTGATRTPAGEAMDYLKRIVLNFNGDECLTWPYYTSTYGYGIVTKDGKQIHATRVICEELYGHPPTPEHEAAHSCGRGHFGCITPRHLRWATPKENTEDKFLHGTVVHGESCHAAKLSASAVLAIYSLKGTDKQENIATAFNVTRRTVGRIWRREIWTRVLQGA
jgi:hypothetical protein